MLFVGARRIEIDPLLPGKFHERAFNLLVVFINVPVKNKRRVEGALGYASERAIETTLNISEIPIAVFRHFPECSRCAQRTICTFSNFGRETFYHFFALGPSGGEAPTFHNNLVELPIARKASLDRQIDIRPTWLHRPVW